MADVDNLKNEQLQNAAQHEQKSSNISKRWPPLSPWAMAPDASKEITSANISDNSLTNIQKVAQQLVMNSPDRQRALIRPHLRSTAPPYEDESPDSCPPPPNNTPDSGPSNTTSNRGSNRSAYTSYSTVKVLKPPEKSTIWTGSPIPIPESTPVGIHGLAPPISSSRWTATPVSLEGSPGNVFTPGSALSNISNKVQYHSRTPNKFTSPIPSIVVTPPVEPFSPSNSYILSTPESPYSSDLGSIVTPRLRSDSEGSVSSILSLNSAMLKLIDSTQESIGSSLEGFKGSDDQSEKSSDLDSPVSITSKSSPMKTPKDDGGKKKDKDMRKKLLQDLMAAEVQRHEDEVQKNHKVELMESYTPKVVQGQSRLQHLPHPGQPTYGSVPCKIVTIILCLAMASLLIAWLFMDTLGPLERRILVGDYDSLDAAKEPHRLPWIPEDEMIGNTYKYGGVKKLITKITSEDIGSEDKPISTGHDIDENMSGTHGHIFDNIEEADLNVLDASFGDLNRLEEIIFDEIENESNESSDSEELDDGLEFDKLNIENMKPTILKLLYHNILKVLENGDINMKSYTNMYRYLNSFLTTFGSFAATQSKMLNDRIHTLEQLKEHNIDYKFASTMFKYEFESGLIDDEFPISGSMIFTCLHRHLQYLQQALENFVHINPRQSLYVAFRAAYDNILAEYHHWFVEKFYLLGLATLPTKEDALRRINERFVETSSISQLSNGLELVSEQLKKLTKVTEILLNKHNVLQMIPAQVIT